MLLAENAEEIKTGTGFPPIVEDNAVGTTGQQLRFKTNDELEYVIRQSVFWAATIILNKAKLQLSSLAKLNSNWDSYGAPAPNETSLKNANRILKQMKASDLTSAHIVPSAEGGIGFCFTKGDRYADIESSNDGDIIGVRYAGMQVPTLIEIDGTDDSIEAALQLIRDHIRV